MTKKIPKRYYLIYLFTLPGDILCWLTVFAIRVLWGTKLQWCNGLWCELKANSWPSRTWYRVKFEGKHVLNKPDKVEQYGKWRTWGGTTLGHGGFYGPGRTGDTGVDTKIEAHEHIHVEQYEVVMLTTFILAGVFISSYVVNVNSVLGIELWSLAIWLSGYLLMGVCGWLVAWLRGEHPYRGSTHEESAYAQTEQFKKED